MTDRYSRYKDLKFDRPEEHVLRICINRPDRLNALTTATHTELVTYGVTSMPIRRCAPSLYAAQEGVSLLAGIRRRRGHHFGLRHENSCAAKAHDQST
jgi:1,4-dihydroxy-2-naphthoyl-CoA synthase